jgi:hypothetical protein
MLKMSIRMPLKTITLWIKITNVELKWKQLIIHVKSLNIPQKKKVSMQKLNQRSISTNFDKNLLPLYDRSWNRNIWRSASKSAFK